MLTTLKNITLRGDQMIDVFETLICYENVDVIVLKLKEDKLEDTE